MDFKENLKSKLKLDRWATVMNDRPEGYVPNVVYSCGALIHNDVLIIPYTMSDINSGIATVIVKELLGAMRKVT
jgi:hypothetical protein